MGTLNVPQAEAAVIKSIDTQHLSSLVDQCIRDEHGSGMRGLRLHECGPYVSARLYAFERALADYAAAKSAKKRESTGYDAYKTGSDLENAVGQMQHRVAIEEQERDRFFVDDQVMAPFSLHEELHVQVCFRWRDNIEAAWQYGSTTFSHTYVAPPDYRQRTLARKPSAACRACKGLRRCGWKPRPARCDIGTGWKKGRAVVVPTCSGDLPSSRAKMRSAVIFECLP